MSAGRRLTLDDADKLGPSTLDPQTAGSQIAAKTASASDRVQIHVKVSRTTRQKLKLLADGAGTSYQDLAERFILEGIERARDEVGKIKK